MVFKIYQLGYNYVTNTFIIIWKFIYFGNYQNVIKIIIKISDMMILTDNCFKIWILGHTQLYIDQLSIVQVCEFGLSILCSVCVELNYK